MESDGQAPTAGRAGEGEGVRPKAKPEEATAGSPTDARKEESRSRENASPALGTGGTGGEAGNGIAQPAAAAAEMAAEPKT